MKIHIENTGPIKKAILDVKPLTFICGPNNSGKTYLSYATYGVHDSWTKYLNYHKTDEIVTSLREGKSSKVHFDDYIAEFPKLSEKASERFSSRLHGIFSTSKDYFKTAKISVDIVNDKMSEARNYKSRRITVNGIEITFQPNLEERFLSVNATSQNDVISGLREVPTSILSRMVDESISRFFTANIFSRPFLVPAERTGVSLFYKELDISKNVLVEALQSLKDKDEDTDSFDPFLLIDKTTSRYAQPLHRFINFVRDFERIQPSEGQLFKENKEIRAAFESFVDGRFHIKDGVYAFSNNRRKENKVTIPLYIASQFLKSMFPVTAYFKHIAKKGDLLIIDEPELNLHPDNQRKLMRILAMLANAGIKVLITTHSDHLIQELQSLVLLGKVRNTDLLEKYAISKLSVLKESDVSFNVLNEGTLENIEFDAEMGYNVRSIATLINNQNNLYTDLIERTLE